MTADETTSFTMETLNSKTSSSGSKEDSHGASESSQSDEPNWQALITLWANGSPEDAGWLGELFNNTPYELLAELQTRLLISASDQQILSEHTARQAKRETSSRREAERLVGVENGSNSGTLANELTGWISTSHSPEVFFETLQQLLRKLPVEDLRQGIVGRRPRDESEAEEIKHEWQAIHATQESKNVTHSSSNRYLLKHRKSLSRTTQNNIKGKLENILKPLNFSRVTQAQLQAVAKLGEKFPNAENAIELIGRNLRRRWQYGDDRVHLRPMILTGEPGTGKTRLCREIGKILNVHVAITTVAGHSDSQIFGVSGGWSSASPSVMTTAISDSGSMNPLIMVDEIDKVRPSQNGDVWAEFLGLLEPTEAQTYYERFLATNVDASGISWVFTANDVTLIPRPFLSRCMVCRIEPPLPTQIRAIIRSLISDYAQDLGIDQRFLPVMSGDLEQLEESWPKHRSVRILSELLKILLDDRQKFFGKA
ncbi:AAA family ATPase [Phaeobacter sp. G2]|nr:AAA family ATPase [Phaeobacter sp. G2]